MAINVETVSGNVTTVGNVNGTISGTGNLTGSASPTIFNYHPSLTGRALSEQHPIDAITNLSQELIDRPSNIITDAEIQLLD